MSQRAVRLSPSRGTRARKTTIEHGSTLYEPKISSPLAFGGSASILSSAVSNSRSHWPQSADSLGRANGISCCVVGVEQDQQMVADDRRAVFVDVDVAAHQMDAQAADVAGCPIVARHFVARRIEPDDFGRLLAVERFAVEEAAAMERRLFAVDGDQAANELQQISSGDRRASS